MMEMIIEKGHRRLIIQRKTKKDEYRVMDSLYTAPVGTKTKKELIETINEML